MTHKMTLSLFGLAISLLLMLSGGESRADDLDPMEERHLWNRFSAEPEMLTKLEKGLGIAAVSGGGRSAVIVDHLLARLSKEPSYTPKVGEALTDLVDQKWVKVVADGKKGINQTPLRGGYIYWALEAPVDATVMLRARGHSYVLVNGVPRGGDVYNKGRTRLPISLKKGTNHLYFKTGRGGLRAEIWQPRAELFPISVDMTLPDIFAPTDLDHPVRSNKEHFDGPIHAGIVHVNAGEAIDAPITLHTQVISGDVSEGFFQVEGSDFDEALLRQSTRSQGIHKMGILKKLVALPRLLRMRAFYEKLKELPEVKKVKFKLSVTCEGRTSHPIEFSLRVRRDLQHYRKTFISTQDGSCQYYAVRPAIGKPKGIVLSLHGASVEAIAQARSYSNKPNLDIVCPTNRRPFGFDWEEWGRRDAIEVLNHHIGSLGYHPQKLPDGFNIYLTGHSMGGHGTWQVAVQNPGKFAAIAPSAGWSEFWNYGGGPAYKAENPATAMLLKAANPSRTINLLPNLKNTGIFIMHGDADKNVPVSEARLMRKELEKIGHKDFDWFEAEGKGHWYDLDDEPGSACLDFGPIFDLFSRRKLQKSDDVREIDFRTYSPSVSSKMHWLEVIQQTKQLELTKIKASRKIHKREFTITTENVQSFAIDQEAVLGLKDLKSSDDPIKVLLEIDGQEMELGANGLSDEALGPNSGPDKEAEAKRRKPLDRLIFQKLEGKWQLTNFPRGRNFYDGASFKDAFLAPVLVVGNKGSDAETAMNFAKARFDSEQFLYRGNASLRVRMDSILKRSAYGVCYGNADTHRNWPENAEIEISRGRIAIGDRVFEGKNYGLVAILGPEVGVVASTGLAGQMSINHLRYFLSGTGFPDWAIYSDEMLTKGSEGVVAAGFFDNDWKYDESQSGFAKPATPAAED